MTIRTTAVTAVTCMMLIIGGPAMAETPEDNIQVVQDCIGAYGEGDLERLASFMAEDIVWRIPRHHPLFGEKSGREEVIAFFSELSKADFKADPIYFGADETHVVDVHRGWSNVEGAPNVDTIWALVYRIEDGKIAEATNLSADQDAANAFFWSNCELKPIPERLAE